MTEIQMFVIATVASLFVWLLKNFKADMGAGWLTTLVYAAALVLAFFFAPVALPAFPVFSDLVTFVPALIAWCGAALVPLSAFVGFATLVYNALLKAILDKYALPIFKRLQK